MRLRPTAKGTQKDLSVLNLCAVRVFSWYRIDSAVALWLHRIGSVLSKRGLNKRRLSLDRQIGSSPQIHCMYFEGCIFLLRAWSFPEQILQVIKRHRQQTRSCFVPRLVRRTGPTFVTKSSDYCESIAHKEVMTRGYRVVKKVYS